MEVEHVFEYSVRLMDDFVSDEHIYTNIDFVEKTKKEHAGADDEWRQMALVEEKDVSQVEGDMKVRTASWTGSIVSVSESPVRLHSTRLYPVFVSYPLNTETKETDAEIILEEFKPISYLIR